MNPHVSRRIAGAAAIACVPLLLSACRKKDTPAPPVATPTVTLSRTKAPLGSPLDITYKFIVAPDAKFTEDYRVMIHVVDADEQMIFALDHNPQPPTTQWKSGQTIEYTRTDFLPVYPYVGEASVQIGLYSPTTQRRLPLAGTEVAQRAYRVARLQLQPQTENVYLVFKDGWHPAETAEHNSQVEWQWTKKTATIDFKNPKRDATFYLDLDNPGSGVDGPQQVQVSLAGQPIERVRVTPAQPPQLHRIRLSAEQLGTADMAEIRIDVDKTFVPASVPASNSKDQRELGVRVFHAFVQPNN
jgi:hypothetical protein